MNLPGFGGLFFAALVVGCSWLGAGSAVRGAEPLTPERVGILFEEARQLQRDGKSREAFLKYVQVPGGETAAIAVARTSTSVAEFLELLRKNAGPNPTPQSKMVEGELSLALKNREWALACFREAATLIGRKRGAERETGMLSREDYFVEPVVAGAERAFYHEQLIPPFSVGPGSHRDNRLIRRFIALEAWDDAAREFACVWELHREASQPFVRAVPVWIQPDAAAIAIIPADALHAENVNPIGPHRFRLEKRLFRPAGFNGQGLQFALDYAFFLQRRNEAALARGVLLEPLLAIDMDRDPNSHSEGEKILDDQPLPAPERAVERQQHGHFGRAAGVSRKEFIRLVYGDFQSRGQSTELVTRLNDRIKAKQNGARRTLARVRGHQGLPDEALELELAYIAAGDFDPLTAAYRKGLVLDDARKIPEAMAEFERVLSLPLPDDKIANVPDPDEVTSDGGQYSQVGGGRFHSGHGAAMNQLHPLATQHLQRLYAAQGSTNKLLNLTLRQAESEPHQLTQVEWLEQLIQRFRVAKQEDRVTGWIKQRLEEAKDPNAVAALAWVTGDLDRAARAVAASTNRERAFFDGQTEPWKERFRKVGPDQFKMLLTLVVKANPKDGRSRLELLDLESRLDGVEAMESLELLLASNAAPAFVRGKGQRNRTQFSGYGDLAYRLMRMYERHGKLDELRKLGLRIASGEKPFDRVSLRQYTGSYDGEDVALANACLALAIQYASDRADQKALAEALKDSDWPAAKYQIGRRMAGPWKPQPAAKPIPWANVPAGVTLLVSHDNVLCVAHDDRFVYSGHPWGVSVYTHAGQVVTQIALGEAARTMLVQAGRVWVGTPKGLFRITAGDWTVAHQSLLDDLRSNPTEHLSGVNSLAIDGDLLWLGLQRNVQVLNTKTLELRAYSQEELKFEHPGDVSRFFVDGRYVWAVGQYGTRRCDRTTDEWSAVESVGPRDPTRLIAIVEGTVFGDAYIDDRLRHRLCVIDRETLKVTPIPIIAKADRELVNQPLRYLGKSQGLADQMSLPDWDGKHLFTGDVATYYLDKQSQALKPLPESVFQKLHERLHERELKRSSADPRLKAVLRMLDQRDEFVDRAGVPQVYDWTEMTLPNGTLVAGHRLGNTRFEYPHEDRPTWSDSLHDLDDAAGGLFFIDNRVKPDGRLEQRILARSESPLRADRVYGVVSGGDHDWLCTDRGLTVLNRDGRVVDRVSRLEGLCANRVVGGATLGGQMYFATAWDDSSGGLAVFDPLTSTFTSLHQGDGLSTDKLKSVGVKDDHLTLTFGPEYLRYSRDDQIRWRQFPPATFDPRTNTFTAQGPPQLSKNEPAGRTPIGGVADPLDAPNLDKASPDNDLFGTPSGVKRPNERAAPFLGGTVLYWRTLNGRTFTCGTRGVVIEETVAGRAGKPAGLTIASLGARLVPSVASQQLADAVSRKPVVGNLEELKAALQDKNPLYRANAIAMLHGKQPFPANDVVPLIAGQLNDLNRRLRCTALFVLTQFKADNLVVPLLKERLKDTDRNIRSVAMLELTRRGNVPELSLLREFFRREDHINFPFGAESTAGVRSSFHEMHAALAPHATKEIFELLLENPPRVGSYDHKTKNFPQLGRSLLRHPDAIATLLAVRADQGSHDPQVEFVREVFQFAGNELLPTLHSALQSEDRVVRSNAARGCGAIGDPSSIEPLINALNLESGLSRASIIWSLGELKARAALPVMARMYVDARNDEQRRGSGSDSGAGFRASQSRAVMSAQYESIRSLDAIGADWNELNASTPATPVDPRHQEELFQPRHVLEAVAKIGPAESQAFYRLLAAESDNQIRKEAAIQLAVARKEDRELNIPVLKSLLTVDSQDVRVAAAASLLILGQTEGQQPILDALKSDAWWHALEQLKRVSPSQRAFALKEIEAIANDPAKSDEIRNRANNLSRTQAQ